MEKYILKRLYVTSEIPCNVYSSPEELIFRVGSADKNPKLQQIRKSLLAEMFTEAEKKSDTPLIRTAQGIIWYGYFSDTEKNLLVFGPAAIQPLPSNLFLKFCKENGLPAKETVIPVKGSTILLNTLCIAFWAIHGKAITEDYILKNSTSAKASINTGAEAGIHSYRFDKTENEIPHLSYAFERDYLKRVESGDINGLQSLEYNEMNLRQHVGILAKSMGKQMEYMGVSNITLLCRAAINGGLDPAEAYDLSEYYMQRLDACNQNEYLISRLLMEAQREFTKRVHEKKQRKQKNYVEFCKTIIAQNVYKRLTMDDIARQVGVSRNHLSRMFTKDVGMTIKQYEISMRVKAASNMLKYSDYPISMIAEYLCFSSQSHFGKEFKRLMGMTPFEYREKNKVNDLEH